MIIIGKTYIDSVKYLITIQFEVSGTVDKPDIVGAIFGQSEGLLGEEMDLRELQQSGKIGRIEVNQVNSTGKTKGTMTVPSALSMAETTLLAAAVESVDKVGPFDSKFETKKIEDIRGQKRTMIKDRAKELLQKFVLQEMPGTQELAEEVRNNVRASEVKAYGPEKLPAGPSIDEDDSIIVVEGRADVINLLRNNIKNVIAMNGANISKTIIDLSKKKTVTLFVDGDRGGDLNIRQLMQAADIDYIAKAPEGKEVEELVRKEIVMALRKKVPAQQFMQKQTSFAKTYPKPYQRRTYVKGSYQKRGTRSYDRSYQRRPIRRSYSYNTPSYQKEPEINTTPSQEEMQTFQPIMETLKGSLKAKLLDEKGKEVKEVNVRDLVKEMPNEKKAKTVVFDGIITKRLVEEAQKTGINTIVGVKKAKIDSKPEVKILTIEN